MIKIIQSSTMGKSNKGWLKSTFHFSFAEYYNPDNMQFGKLRVVNDDTVAPQNGFDTHSHKNMEIISYVVHGALTHQDSMGNKRELTRGQVQYMSAGTGVAHSEHNVGKDNLRFLQIWIVPDKNEHTPQYGDHCFAWEEREHKWLQIASGKAGKAPITIHQDAEIFVIYMDAGEEQTYALASGRMAYLIQIEGNGTINGQALNEKDAAEIRQEPGITLKAIRPSHYIVFDVAE